MSKIAAYFSACVVQLKQQREVWVNWIPVIFSIGIVLYFNLNYEPDLSSSGSLFAGSAMGLYLSLHRPKFFLPFFVFLLIASAGFAASHYRSWSVSKPILQEAVGPTWVRGEVEKIEKQTSGHRVLLRDAQIWKYPKNKTPYKIRLNVRTSISDAKVGDFISVRAKISPPPEPVLIGSYDFARWAYFKQIGAVGFTLSEFEIRERAEQRGTGFYNFFSRLSAKIGERISNNFEGEKRTAQGGIALALLTGDRGMINKNILEEMRKVGLGHLLAISGLHLVLVTASVFFFIRAGLALIPKIALRYNIKKWAALVALLAGFFYLNITGSPVSAQRAFIMVGLFLLAILLDRVGTPMRPAIWAALIILILNPESLLGPSFQMSFAAAIALIAAYQSVSWDNITTKKGGLKGGRKFLVYVLSIVFSSIVAGVATAPYSIYHFGNVAPYSIMANMLAIPITTIVVMPTGLLGLILMPFGLDYYVFQVMGFAIGIIVDWADYIYALPQSTLNVPTINEASLVLITLGGLWICFWKKQLRYAGILPIIVGIAMIPFIHNPPNIVIEKGAKLFALKISDSKYLFSDLRSSRFARQIWTQKFGLDENIKLGKEKDFVSEDVSGDIFIRCERGVCEYENEGRKAVIIFSMKDETDELDNLEQHCDEADIIVNLRGEDNKCKTSSDVIYINKQNLLDEGTHQIWVESEEISVKTVSKEMGSRPWTNF